MEKPFSPPEWRASHSSEMRLSSDITASTSAAPITSKAAPPSCALRQLRRSTSRLRPCREKLSSGTTAASPAFWMAKPISTISGSSSGPEP